MFLVDRSGSMENCERDKRAGECLVKLLKVLDKFSGTAIVGYSNPEDISVIKSFREKLNKDDNYYIEKVLSTGKYTYEAEGMAKAIDLMKKRKGKRIIITITDGNPEESRSKRIPLEKAKKMLLEAKSMKIVTIGVGIQNSHVERYYPISVVVRDLKDLYDGTIKALCHVIRRGI